MLGVKQSASVHTSKASSPRAKGTRSNPDAEGSVRTARAEVDVEVESGEDRESPKRAANGDEDESRYDIRDKRQPPTKRRRMGTQKDIHTVYTSDEDEDDVDGGRGGDERLVVHAHLDGDLDESETDSVAAEEAEYDISLEDKASKIQRKRSFWLSKGVIDLS